MVVRILKCVVLCLLDAGVPLDVHQQAPVVERDLGVKVLGVPAEIRGVGLLLLLLVLLLLLFWKKVVRNYKN